MFKPPVYTSERQKELQWLNASTHFHDFICGCDEPGNHLLLTLLKHNNWMNLSDTTKKEIQQCLSSTTLIGENATATYHTEGPGEELEEGLLEKLFSEENDFTG